MMKFGKYVLAAAFSLTLALSASASDRELDKAMTLYRSGLYAQAMDVLQSHPKYGKDPIIDGYAALCAINQKVCGYETMVDNYLQRYQSSSLCDDIRLQKGFDYFDKTDYVQAHNMFESVNRKRVPKDLMAEYLFKDGYSLYMTQGIQSEAVFLFREVAAMPMNDYSASAQYCLGYTRYLQHNIDEALEWFAKSAVDERYTAISNYYIIICNYELRNYDFVLEKGIPIYEEQKIPLDRKAHLARLISESYLVKGDKVKAMEYYNSSDDGSAKSRADYFFAGSLMYANEDYKGAIKNFDLMKDKTDSLGQIALYQAGFAYLGLKNKVAATSSFKEAAALGFDQKLREDAMFNYAKLAFDVNRDVKPFKAYMSQYSDKVRGERIYSYMALAALQEKDYNAAIEYYDTIENLDDVQKSNYVHANYLLGAQYLENGAYRSSIQCMEAVAYYVPQYDVLNQLARYYLGEAMYKSERYADAQKKYHELYNEMALVGMPQNELLSYNLAYSYYKGGDSASALKWFEVYTGQKGKLRFSKDALVRIADCHFMAQDYKDAVAVYEEVVAKYDDKSDLYPYYQAALSYGLLKKNDKKLKVLQSVKGADPAASYYEDIIYETGLTQIALKKVDDAKKTFSSLLTENANPDIKAKALLELGSISRQKKDYAKALDYYKQVVSDMRGSSYADDALLAIESVYKSRNQVSEYFKYLDSIGQGESKTEADKEELYFKSAEQLYYTGEYAKSLASLQEFKTMYPQSARCGEASYLIAECHFNLGTKEQACDAYKAVMENTDYRLKAAGRCAKLSYELGNYEDAYKCYSIIWHEGGKDSLPDAVTGALRSAFLLKNYDDAIAAADALVAEGSVPADISREAQMVKAKSLIATSRRDEAFAVLEPLAKDPSNDEGAEAAYLFIQDYFDKGDFDKVYESSKAFAAAKPGNKYYLAKSFIVLGDSYAEQGKMKQAASTFEQVLSVYTVKDDGVLSDVQMRLDKIKEMQ